MNVQKKVEFVVFFYINSGALRSRPADLEKEPLRRSEETCRQKDFRTGCACAVVEGLRARTARGKAEAAAKNCYLPPE